jgi:hypothetical protein
VERMRHDAVLNKLISLKLPVTRDNYIKFAYFGEKTFDQLSAEERAELPELWDDNGNIIQ